MGRARARGGDHRREGRRRHGAHHGRMGAAPAGRRDRLAAADGDRQDRRQPAGKASRRRSAAVGHPRARSHAGPRRADLRAHARRARRRRAEDHRRRTCRASATRNTTPATASSPPISICARRRTSRSCAGSSARPTCSRRATGRARSAIAASRPRRWRNLRPGIVFVSLCAFSHVGPWASRRGFDTVVQTVSGITGRQGELFPGAEPGPAVLSGVGDRLPDGLSDGVRRDGGARPPRARGRQLARAHLAGADRALARRARPGAGGPAEGRAEGIHRRGARALVDDERHAGRSAAPPRRRWCASPRRRRAGPGPRCRSATTSRCGRRGARSPWRR